MEKLLCPSMMCANFENLKAETTNLDLAGADIFHMDFMDGRFVPNFGIGMQDFELVRASTDKFVDVHLMIEDPGNYVEMFADKGADIIYVHPESDRQITRTLEKIHQKKKKVGIALNPGTSIEMVKELFPLIDYLMVMTVNPGFAGQAYLDFVDTKIESLVAAGNCNNFEVMVDGAISPEKIVDLSQVGVTGFVLGTSALFKKSLSYEETFKNLRKIGVMQR